ncbi:hypothetical protein OCH7691_00104 [Oceanibacterium hippocampi]|uniref:DUF922 domain-containing protein n=2 Tax=Oceanibacterium hippocampi TaxID=745714 RepID=A0A1Y5R8T6_9PROT|nr:hypothetical protein OCH7691_00104 [Oceanibacterium hippocampi]
MLVEFGRKQACVALIAATGMFLLAGAADAASCRNGEADIDVRIDNEAVKIDHSRSVAELSNRGGAALGPALGLTVATPRSEISSRFEWQEDEKTGDIHCLRTTDVKAAIGAVNRIVHIAREFPRGSCEYREILQHEYKHVATDERLVRDLGRRLRVSLRAALSRSRPPARLRAADSKDALAAIRSTLQRVLDEASDRLAVERRRNHAEIDTRAEYERVGAACGRDSLFRKVAG